MKAFYVVLWLHTGIYNFLSQWNAFNEFIHINARYVHAMKDLFIQKYVTIDEHNDSESANTT